MPGDALHAGEGLAARVRALGHRSSQLVALRDRLTVELARKQAEIGALSDRIEKLTKVGELLRLLMDLLVNKQVRVVEGVVTQGFQTIFHDQILSFEAEVGTKYNKVSIDFFVRCGAKGDPLSHRGKPLESFGGGPATVASLVLRIITILRLKRFPLLMLDEALLAVSDEYTDQTSRFLARLADKLGIDVLLVTHNHSFLNHANTAYRFESTEGGDGGKSTPPLLTLRSLK